MKPAYYCLVAFANIVAASVGNALTSQCLTPTVGDHGAEGNNTVAGQAQICTLVNDIQNDTEAWNKTGGFHYLHNGVELYYTIQGSGDPILLIHGWVITMDQRGHGRSSAPEPAIYSLHSPYLYDPVTLANDAAALLEYLKVGNATARGAAIVMGHSLGGVVASELAFRNPHLVKALVLVDPGYYISASQGALVVADLKNASAETVPEVAASIFDAWESYVVETPPWIRAWRSRRTWGMPGYVASAVFEQMMDFLGQWSLNAEYRKERKGIPKLVTVAQQSSADLENEVGLAEEDRVELVNGGHWHF